MHFLVKLALLNMLRHGRRTLITAGAIAFGVLFFIFLDSMLKGADSESVRNLKWYETSSTKILNKDYWDNRAGTPLDYLINSPDEVISLLKDKGYEATKRVEFAGEMVFNSRDFGEEGSIPVRITAIDPQRDEKVFHFHDTLEEGRFLKPDDEGVLFGSWLAEDLHARVGSTVTIITRGVGGFFEAVDLEIVGIVNCPNPTVNRRLIMMPLLTADRYLALEGSVTEIDIKLSDSRDTSTETADITELLSRRKDLAVFGFARLASDYLTMMEMEKSSTGMILLLVFIIAAVGISNTMLLSLYERFREVGMMRALGMADRKIAFSLLLEAAGIGFLGSVLGILLGIGAVYFLIHVGIDYGFATRDYDIVYRVQSVFRGEWNWGTMALSSIAATLMSVIVAWFPIRRGLLMDIPSCLKHQ